jgi:excisionase family DNA binding protein
MLSQISPASGTNSGHRPKTGPDRFFEKQTGFALTKSDYVDEWLTSDEAAAFLKISPATLRNLTSSGKIPFYKFGCRNRYCKRELKNMLLSNRKGA